MDADKIKYKQVMLIDDSDVDNFVNEKIIFNSGFASSVICRGSAQAAIEHIKENSPQNYPDVLFIDLNMPIMDGFEFIDYLYVSCPDIIEHSKLVILTSSVHEKDKLKAEALAEHITFLNKPLTQEMLFEI
jgi:CheY-like chemotaxis protein